MKISKISLFAAIVLAVGLLAGVHRPVSAATRPYTIIPDDTVLKVMPIGPQELSKSFSVTALLTTTGGQPLADMSVNFLVGGLFEGQARTDAKGQAVLPITTDYSAGNYTLKAVFQGTRLLNASAATTDLVIQPSTVEVETVPALQGVKFQLGDQVFVSGADGTARIAVNRAGDYTLQVLNSNQPDSNQRVEFNRWMDENFTPYRQIRIPQDKPIQVGFQVSYKVGQTFVDLQNNPVDISRITSINLKSSQGTSYTFNDGQPRWLPASLVTRRVGGLTEVLIQYSVMNVQVDGSNVVSQAQQRFYGHPGETWPIQLLLYSATISSKDAFLGIPVGKGFTLDYPDGTRQHYTFGPSHSVTVNSLARGIYHVRIDGVSGFTPSTPVALSQNQVMKLSVLTRVDIFMAVTAGSLFAFGLIAVGRARILRRRRKVRRVALPQRQVAPGLSEARER